MQLEKRIERSDGAVALCVFRREDGRYQFRIDTLRPADDECHAYWLEGYPLSGLYCSVQEAEAAGIAGVEWQSAP